MEDIVEPWSLVEFDDGVHIVQACDIRKCATNHQWSDGIYYGCAILFEGKSSGYQ